MLRVRIQANSDQPIYLQIVQQIRDAVSLEKIQTGDPVPSVRQLATDLTVNPNTIAKAYGELVQEGVLESQRGRGYFVAERRSVFSKAEQQRRIAKHVEQLASEAKSLGIADADVIRLVQKRLDQLSPSSNKKRSS